METNEIVSAFSAFFAALGLLLTAIGWNVSTNLNSKRNFEFYRLQETNKTIDDLEKSLDKLNELLIETFKCENQNDTYFHRVALVEKIRITCNSISSISQGYGDFHGLIVELRKVATDDTNFSLIKKHSVLRSYSHSQNKFLQYFRKSFESRPQ
jgi:hypothetical protein